MSDAPRARFNFGENWTAFSANALDEAGVSQARRHFLELVAGISLKGSSFLDLGFGQGLSLLAAAELGATARGCDIDPECARALEISRRFFPSLERPPEVMIGSILDPAFVRRLREASPGARGYDIVHSWGVLHHTGDLIAALAHACELVAPGGYLIVAVYNRHWSSPGWRWVKRLYVGGSRRRRRMLVAVLRPVVYSAKWLVTGRDPRRQERGMDFDHDLVDWIGGFPYQCASVEEMGRMMAARPFALLRVRRPTAPTGCNEYVWRRD